MLYRSRSGGPRALSTCAGRAFQPKSAVVEVLSGRLGIGAESSSPAEVNPISRYFAQSWRYGVMFLVDVARRRRPASGTATSRDSRQLLARRPLRDAATAA
jgi:hypothetical protein